MNCDRRGFIELAVVAGAAAPLAWCRTATGSTPRAPGSDQMGVLADLTKCNGCRRCEAACREANGFAVPTQEELQDRSIFLRRRRPGPSDCTVVNMHSNGGTDQGRPPVYVKSNCLHCVTPACASACLVGALRRQPDGAVTYDADKCMGCRYCMVACPFGIPAYEYDNALTPRVRKCDFCAARRAAHAGEAPACVQACPKECLTYAPRAELLDRARARIAERPDLYVDRIYGEREAGGTSWLYLSGTPFEELGFLTVSGEIPQRLTEAIQHAVFEGWVPPLALYAVLGLVMWLGRTQGETDDRAEGRRPVRIGVHRARATQAAETLAVAHADCGDAHA